MLKIENAAGTVLAYLNNLTEATVKEVLNGEYTLSFVAIVDHLKTDFLYDENNLINYNDDLFRPVKIEELHDEDDELTVSVQCEHISYDLINNVMNDFNHTYVAASDVMALCLQGTDFSLRTCDITEKTDIQYTQECTSKQISIAIANNWHGELRYYRNYIDLLHSRGKNRGTGFIFGKNLKSVKRIINRSDSTTSYDVEIIEGSETEELGYYELGDKIRVIDKRLNIDYECKIIEIEKDIITGLNSNVILGDAIKDMRSSFSNIKQDVKKINDTVTSGMTDWNKVKDILNQSGDVILGKLNELGTNTLKIVNSTGTFEQRDNGLYWQDQPTKETSTFATFWGAQGIMFARTKDANGEWVWESALDANGLTATQVVASALYGITMEAVNIVAGTLTGGNINGATIAGGSAVFGAVSNDGRLEITETGTLKGYDTQGRQSVLLVKNSSGKLELKNNIDGINIVLNSFVTTETIPEFHSYFEGAGIQVSGGKLILDVDNDEVIIKATKVRIAGDLEYTGRLVQA